MKLPEILTRDQHLKTKQGEAVPPTSYATEWGLRAPQYYSIQCVPCFVVVTQVGAR